MKRNMVFRQELFEIKTEETRGVMKNKQQSIEREEKKMRKTRSDCRVGTFEKKHGLPPGTIRNKDGRDTRSDKKIGTIRKEAK